MSRQEDSIDLIQLHATQSARMWNYFLTKCRQSWDLQTLTKVRYGLQAGMDDLVKKKLNTEKMVLFYIRLNRSIENTMKEIIREKNPSPHDDPLAISRHSPEALNAKRVRDKLFQAELKKRSY